MSVTKVFGPPGTGKTTYLLNVVDTLLQNGTPASSIGYFAFTRKAAHEAKERAYARFQQLDFKRDLANFRTLHSLAYARLGIQASRIATAENYKEFAVLAKINLNIDRGDESWEVRADHPILNVLNLARIKGTDLRVEYNNSKLDIGWHHFYYVYQMYRKYMNEKGLLDFTDLLEMFAEADDVYYPQLEVVIIDEAQDLSPLQWKIADRLIKRAKKAYIAGDDDQCQPPGTKVLTTEGEVNIEELDSSKHRLICYERNGSYVVGKKNGYAFKKAVRQAETVLYQVTTGSFVSRYTDNHYCIVRWKDKKEILSKYVVYVMQKGDHFRVGYCQFMRVDGCVHAWVRAYLEKADKMWFLKIVDTKNQASYWEDYFSYKHGIPQNIFKDKSIFEALDTKSRVLGLFAEASVDIDYPVYEKEQISQRRGGSQIFTIHAAALCPDLMRIAVREGDVLSWRSFTLDRFMYKGPVYSLAVDKHHNYFADGILTHNCIFGWAGADVRSLLTYPGDQIVLDQSYRIPKVVHDYSNKIIHRVKYRVPKEWNARDEQGELHFYQRYSDVDLVDGTWLILAPTNYMLNDVHEYLKSMGILFERQGIRSIGEGPIEAVYAWEDLRKGKSIGQTQIKALYSYLGSEGIARGFRKFLGEPDQFYDFARLQAEGGLIAQDRPWYEALEKLSDANRVYIRAALRRGQSLRGKPRIRISTIHGAKGGEADHVLLLTDLSTQFTREQEINPDSINRLYYVGLTRTRKTLHIVYPQDEYKAFRL